MKGLTLYTEEQAAKTVRSLYDDLSRRILHFPRGNCPVELTGAFLRLCLAQSCGKCVPCRIGLDTLSSLIDRVLDGKAEEKDAVSFIIDTVRENPGEVELIVLGPATNIALAIERAPEVIKSFCSGGRRR